MSSRRAAPETGRVERINPVPFKETRQNRNDAFTDNFDRPMLDLEWNFRRVPRPDAFSLKARKGFLRLNAGANTIKERESCSLLGIRQKESDFEYRAKMRFSPGREEVEAGINLFQKDDNYLSFTVIKQFGKNVLRLILAEPGKAPRIIKKEVLNEFNGEIIFQVFSRDHKYHYAHSLDEGKTFKAFTETAADHILSKGYTGAYLGLYGTSNGKETGEYADFDWVNYKGFERF